MQDMDAGKRKCWRLSAVILSFLSALLLSCILLVLSVLAASHLTPGYFEKEYEKYGVRETLPELSVDGTDGLAAVTKHLRSYLLHGQDPEELQIKVNADGETRPFFTEREIGHMGDVRVLYMTGIRIAAFALIFIIIFMGSSRLLACENEPKIFRVSTGIGILCAAVPVLTGAAGMAVYVLGDFDRAFLRFHEVFFTNDLWIPDPAEGLLVRMLPQGFFFDTAYRIVLYYVVLMVLLIAAGAVLIVRGRRVPDYEYSAF